MIQDGADMYDSRLKSNDGDALMDAILSLKNIDECYMFFEDLCTVAELNSIFQRYKVANMLVDKHTCLAIAEETGASTATVSRVNKCLNYGTGGYKLIIDRNRK